MSCKSGLLPMITKFSEILTDKFPMVQEKCPPKKKGTSDLLDKAQQS